jgi:hypothetical protein
MNLEVPKGTPERTVLIVTIIDEYGNKIVIAITQLPGGRFDDSEGVKQQNCELKIKALREIFGRNPDIVVTDANSVILAGECNIHSYIESLIKGYRTRQSMYHARKWMFLDQKDKISGKSILDETNEMGYGILYFDTPTSLYIDGDVIGPEFIFYKESVFTPVSSVSSSKMYDKSNLEKRYSDHRPIAVTLCYNKTGEFFRVINANVECYFGAASADGTEIDKERLYMLANKLII